MAFGFGGFSNPFGGKKSSTPAPAPQNTVTVPTSPARMLTSIYGGRASAPGASVYNNYGPGGQSIGTLTAPRTNYIPATPQADPADWARRLYDQYMGQAAPVFATYQDQIEEYERQQREIESAAGGAGGAASRGAELQNRGLDLDFEQLGIDRASLGRQTPLLDQLFGLRERSRGSERDYLKSMDQLGEESLVNQLAGADLTKKSNTRAARSDAVARGATVTQGLRDSLGDIDESYSLTTKQFRLERAREAAGIKAKWDDNYFQGQIDAATTAEEKAKIQDQYKAFDILEKRLNLSREQIANSLSQTLASLNLNKVLSVGQVMSALLSTKEKSAQLAFELLGKAGIDASVLNQAGMG